MIAKSKKTYRLKLALLLVGLIVLLGHHFFFYYGHFGFDDMTYARQVSAFLDGNANWSDHFTHRLTIILATALSYTVLGVNDFSSALPALCLSACIFIGIFQVSLLQKWHPIELAFAFAIYFSAAWNLFYSDKLMVDIYLSAFILWAYIIYIRYADDHPLFGGFLCASFLMLAFLSKGSFVLVLPVFAMWLLTDLLKAKHRHFWLSTVVSGAILLMIYFLSYAYYLDNFWMRFDSIVANSYFNECSYGQMPFDKTVDRWTMGSLKLIHQNFFFVPLLLAIASYVLPQRISSRASAISIFALLLAANFMSISITSYNPMCLDPRHYLYLSPLLAIWSVGIIRCAWSSERFWAILSALYITYLPLIYLSPNLQVTIVHLLILACILAWYILCKWQTQQASKQILLLLMSLLLCYPSLDRAMANKAMKYPQLRHEIKNLIHSIDTETTLVTSKAMQHLVNYYNIDISNKKLDIVPYHDYASAPIGRDILVVENWYTAYHTAGANRDLSKIKKDTSRVLIPLEDTYELIDISRLK